MDPPAGNGADLQNESIGVRLFEMRLMVVVPVALLLLQQNCDNSSQKQVGPAPSPPAINRFTLVPNSAGVAFDTQTGQICRTWDWKPLGKEPNADPVSGNIPQRQFGEFSPTCLSIYQQYPSGTERVRSN